MSHSCIHIKIPELPLAVFTVFAVDIALSAAAARLGVLQSRPRLRGGYGTGERAGCTSTLRDKRRNRVSDRASADGEDVHNSLVGEIGERVEANRLRGLLLLRDKRLDLVQDSLASAEAVGGWDDRGDVLSA